MVTIFTGATCAPCNALKKYLKAKSVAFVEKPIEQDDNRSEAYRLSGYSVVPVTVINNDVVVGLNFGQIAKLLAV